MFLRFVCASIAVFMTFQTSGQDLESEVPPGEKVFFQSVEGAQPRLLDCRLSAQESLDCVSDSELRAVVCEAFHFSKKTPLPGKIAGRAFRCPGTPYDGGNLIAGWKIVVSDKEGRQSTWMVEALNKQQSETMYKLEHRYSNMRSDGEPSSFSLGVLGGLLVNDSGARAKSMGVLSGWQWTDYRFNAQFVKGGAAGPATFRFGAEYTFLPFYFDSASGPRQTSGWYLAADLGRFLTSGQARIKLCAELGHRWRPGRMEFSGQLGHCWIRGLTVNWGPEARFAVSRYFADSFSLGVAGDGLFLLSRASGAQSSNYTARFLLIASFLLQPK